MLRVMDTFPKKQHLCRRKDIEALFGSGNRCISAFPLRVVYKPVEIAESFSEPIQVLFSVSKRRFKHAVDRNRAKRQMREAWRRHRHVLYQRYSTPDAPQHTSPLSGGDSVTSQQEPLYSAADCSAPQHTSPLSGGDSAAPSAAFPALPPLHIAFLWLSETPLPSALVQRKMKKLLCAVSSSFPSASTSDSSPR